MTKKPDVPCSGCGALMWSGRGSKPAGERMCRTCRADPTKPRAANSSARTAEDGRPMALWAGRKGHRWRKLRELVLAEESNCFRCGRDVDKTLPPRQAMSASVDHVVDLAAGGEPYDRENVRLAHHGCNSRAGGLARGARGRGEEPPPFTLDDDLKVAVSSGDRRQALEGVRDYYARLICDPETAPRDGIAAGRELRAVLAELAGGNAEAKEAGGSDELAKRRADRRAAAGL